MSTDLVTKELVQELARELAYGYFSPEQLAERYKIPEDMVHRLQDSPEFKSLVLKEQRDVDEKGSNIKVAARKSVQVLIPEIAHAAGDQNLDMQDRINAFKELVRIAQITKDEGTSGAEAFSVNIQINN